MKKEVFFSIIIFIIGELMLIIKLFTKTSLIISVISLFCMFLISYYLVPKLNHILMKNEKLKKILFNDLMQLIVLILFVPLYGEFLNWDNIYFFYILLHCLLVIITALYQLKSYFRKIDN